VLESPSNSRPTNVVFTTTHWTLILESKEESPEADEALESLCRTYWRPLFTFIRWRGYSQHDAEDLTQEFFSGLLGRDFLKNVDRKKGKFRSFLLAALRNFLAKNWRWKQAQKRGKDVSFISFEDELTQISDEMLASTDLTPELAYDQQWAVAMLKRVMGELEAEYRAEGKGVMFESMKPLITGDGSTERYAAQAERLGMREAAFKMAVSRLRKRYSQVLRSEVARTVADPSQIEEELHLLHMALSQ
jgi:RNA polymerase sigma factor (sigma-70 family)